MNTLRILSLPFLTGSCSLVDKASAHVCKTLDDARERKARKKAAEERVIQTLLDALTDQLKRRTTLRRNTSNSTTTTTLTIPSTTMTMTDILQSLPEDMTAGQVDRLLTLCWLRGLYDCLVVASLRYGKLGVILRFTVTEADLAAALSRGNAHEYRLPVVMSRLFQGDLLDVLVDDEVWPSWGRVLNSMPRINYRVLLLWLARNRVNREGLRVFKILLDASPGHTGFRDVLSQLMSQCLIPQYRTLLFSQKTYMRWYSECPEIRGHSAFSQLNKIGYNCIWSQNNCLIVLCEAGYLTDRDDLTEEYRRRFTEAMRNAVIANQPDIVKFLYSTGSISNATVFQLSRDRKLIANYERILSDDNCLAKSQEDPDQNPDRDAEDPAHPVSPFRDDPRAAAREIRSFLESMASEPRSLKSLCLVQVARGLGWGYAKMAALDMLRDEIPYTLVEELFAGCDRGLLKYSPKPKL